MDKIIKSIASKQIDQESRIDRNRFYKECLSELYSLIPKDQLVEIFAQYECELDYCFLGFVDIYKPLSQLIPRDYIVIDFGCYLAAQSYFFKHHKRYIGVDVVTLKRFSSENTSHFVMSIQEFIEKFGNEYSSYGNKACAICSFVPDKEAVALVKNTFNNVFCYYP